MAFWMDPVIMVGAGLLIAYASKHVYPGNQQFVYAASILTLMVTYLISIGLFVNLEFLEPIWSALGAETGTEYMINGVLFGFVDTGVVWSELSGAVMFWCVFIFTLYPSWLWFGVVLGRLSIGRHPGQEGFVGLLRP